VSRILVLDGATATLQLQTGLDAQAIHRAYLDAGADIISTGTFMARHDGETNAAARVARRAVDEFRPLTPDQPRLVAGVIGVAGAGVRGLIDGGVDLLLAETVDSVAQAMVALASADREPGAPPLMLSVAVGADGRLLSGETLDDLANAIAGAPLFSVGINCGRGVAGLLEPLRELAGAMTASAGQPAATVRVSCHPAAGLPDAFGEYDEPPAVTAAFLRHAARDGLVDIAGGCCGTTPATIGAIARALHGLPARMAGFRE
jgi:5-methyltetrahydrofolate--homocysteine methyltransferase